MSCIIIFIQVKYSLLLMYINVWFIIVSVGPSGRVQTGWNRLHLYHE